MNNYIITQDGIINVGNADTQVIAKHFKSGKIHYKVGDLRGTCKKELISVRRDVTVEYKDMWFISKRLVQIIDSEFKKSL